MKNVMGWGYGSIFLRRRLSPSRDDPFPPTNVAPALWAWVQEMNYLPYLVDTTELRSFFRTQWMRRKPPNFEARIEALFCSEAVTPVQAEFKFEGVASDEAVAVVAA